MVTLYKGETIIPINDWDLEITQSGGIVYTTTNVDSNNINVVVSDVNNMDDSGYLNVVAKAKGGTKILGRAKFSISKSKGTFSLKLQPSVNQIIISYSSDGTYTIDPTAVTVKLLKNDGNYISEITDYNIAYKFNESPVENLIQPGGSIPISYNGSRLYLELKVYDKTNNSLLLDKETIPFVKSGVPGVPGSRGSAIRTLEWREGYTYVNNNDFRDYIYYRTSNPTYEGWYVTKGLSAVANSGYPDLNLFEKQPFTESSIFGNIIAENANLAGFIFRNQQLFSQAGMEQVTNPTYSNMLINGLTGFLKFSEKLYIDKDGITFFDSNKKPRIRFGFEDTETGTPYLRFLAEDGTILWEAGKEYTQWIVTGTTQPSWSTYGARRISDEPEDYVYDEFTSWQFKQNILQFVTNTANYSDIRTMLTPEDPAYFVTGAIPDTVAYDLGGGQYRGALYTLNKGDIKENENLFEGFYITRNSVQNNQVPSAYTLNEGWHLINGMSGINGGIMQARLNGDESQTYYATVFYVKNGIITRYFDVDVHTQTKQTL